MARNQEKSVFKRSELEQMWIPISIKPQVSALRESEKVKRLSEILKQAENKLANND